MSQKTAKKIAAAIAIFLAVVMVITSFGWVFAAESYGMSQEESKYTDEQLAFMKKLMEYIQENYKDEVSAQTMVEGAYTGLLESLGDKYSVFYVSDSEKDSFVETISGEFGGIGISMESSNGQIVVVAPLAGTPAEAAGIQSGDVVVKVDGADVTKKSLAEVATLMRGEEGTVVSVTMERDGDYHTYTMTREKIKTESVQAKMLDDGIGYIKVTSFDNDTDSEFRGAISLLIAEGAKAFILDLRNNTGGYVNTAAGVAEVFLPKGPVVHFVKQGKVTETISASGVNRVQNPLVVLVNGGTASSGEILAGALQDGGVARLVGTTTFGKGIAQQVLNLKNGYSMKMSTLYFVTPHKKDINGIGIKPDFIVENPVGKPSADLKAQYDGFVPMAEKTKPGLGDTGLNVYGAQQRLALLGFDVEVTGSVDEATFQAICDFQKQEGLYPYGTLDYTTKNKLDRVAVIYVNAAKPGEDLQLKKAIDLLK